MALGLRDRLGVNAFQIAVSLWYPKYRVVKQDSEAGYGDEPTLMTTRTRNSPSRAVSMQVLRVMAGEGAAAAHGCCAASLFMSSRAPGVPQRRNDSGTSRAGGDAHSSSL
jgi:hypothetical protein